MSTRDIHRWLLGLVVVSGLCAGCGGAGGGEADEPPPVPATVDEGQAVSADINAAGNAMSSPGVNP